MPDDADLDRPGSVPDPQQVLHRGPGCCEWRSDGEEGIACPHAVSDLIRQRPLPLEYAVEADSTASATGDDDVAIAQSEDDFLKRRVAVVRSKPRLHLVYHHEVGTRILRDEVESEVRSV